MGIYSKYVFPRLMNLGMSGEEIGKYRQEMLSFAEGEILEIGFGTGLNLPYYPKEVKKIHTIDVNAGMNPLASKNIEKSGIRVDYHIMDAENLAFPDSTFDTVVSTWTLCSIKNVDQCLAEIYRVLKPDGRFIFVEHGLSNEYHVQKWQHRVNPIQKVLAEGCHLNRNIEDLIRGAGFRFERLTKQYAQGAPKILSYLYYGMVGK
ncbi:class I SAM-dependent methyltransferase [Telluribacter sp.]|jgi:ubiquinone/menaquinone biosynthesis C-methylase UbiE|uniref:class I SAM-dependent methyltransferase n=1 Tax=Telluribacter sp. TaxID=1978767 RepID=UPI002E126384|nr:class I SAM-dependent methyltransferase [Telluribacter sp.]